VAFLAFSISLAIALYVLIMQCKVASANDHLKWGDQ